MQMSPSKEKRKGVVPAPLNKFMHPRNPYKNPPSFKKLAMAYPKFREFCSYTIEGKVILDFNNPEALRALTTSLLHRDFDLNVNIPNDRLVPTVPLRLNYILWLEDILALSRSRSQYSGPSVGIDIGTGATSIYPLLAAKKNKWFMIGTEVDDLSFQSAIENVEKNNLKENILIKKVEKGTFLNKVLDKADVTDFIQNVRQKSLDEKKEDSMKDNKNEASTSHSTNDKYTIEFTMCNPPFFGSEMETDSAAKNKKNRSSPNSAPTGSLHEKVVEGGEVSFISSMITESIIYKNKIRVFSTLIGSKSNVKEIMRLVSEVKPAHIATTEFCQGKTMRWGVAWTFDSNLPIENIISKKKQSSVKPLILMIPKSYVSMYTVPAIWKKIQDWLLEIKIKPRISQKKRFFIGANFRAYKPLWQNQRRQRRKDKCSNKAVSNNEKRSHEETKDLTETGNTKKVKVDEEQEKTENDMVTVENIEQNDAIENMETDEISDVPNENDGSKKCENLPCLVKGTIYVKSINGNINVELRFLGGILGKDGLNQIFTFLKNKLRQNNN